MDTNFATFETIQRPSAVEDIIDAFKQALLKGDLQPGQRLPSEAQLGRQFGVGRGAIREAMKALSAMGVVEIKRGDGTYISDSISPEVVNPLLFAMLIEAKDVNNLYELREIIDVGYSQLASRKASEADFEHLEALIAEMESYWNEGGRDEDYLGELDMKFHQAILNATQNPLVIKIGQILMAMFSETAARSVISPGGIEWTLDQHRRMVEALRSRDRKTVREAVTRGLEGSKARTKKSET